MMHHSLSYNQQAFIVILVGFLFRVFFGSIMGLGIDETYTTVISRHFFLSYFDHPPLHIWIVGLTRLLFHSENPLILRIPFILMFSGTCWAVYQSIKIIFSEKTAYYSIILLNISAVFSLTGLMILPDAPLYLFLSITLYLWILILFCNKNQSIYWGLSGFSLGLACLSKYHGFLIGAGFFFFLLTQKNKRFYLFTLKPYMMVLISLIIFSPVIIWNAKNNWTSLGFHTGRASIQGFYPLKFIISLLGQSLWILPWIWFPLIYVYLKEVATKLKDEKNWFLLCLGSLPIYFFTIPTLWGAQNLFHWQAPGYFFILPLFADFLSQKKNVKKYFTISATVYVSLVMIIATHCSTGWIKTLKPEWFLKNDPSWDCIKWNDVYTFLKSKPCKISFVASNHWIDSAKIDYGLKGEYPVVCLKENPHHFQFLHDIKKFDGKNALIIVKDKESIQNEFKPYFETIEFLEKILITRMGKKEFELFLYCGKIFNFEKYKNR